MQRLREVVGMDLTANNTSENNFRLDGNSISEKELTEKLESQGHSQKIVEVEDGEYKTLKRMYS